MKTLCVLAALLLFVPAVFAAGSEEDEVMTPIRAFFDGMAKRDAAMIKAPILPGSMFTGMRNGKPSRMDTDALAESMGKPRPTSSVMKMHDPVVKVDGDVAMAFVPFNNYVDGKLHHCGTDVFIVVKTEGRWVISSISDTLHYEGCVER